MFLPLDVFFALVVLFFAWLTRVAQTLPFENPAQRNKRIERFKNAAITSGALMILFRAQKTVWMLIKSMGW